MNPGSFPLNEAVEFVEGRILETPRALVVLGSGLSGLAQGLDDGVSIPYQEIPGFPEPGVAGHAGQLVFGRVRGSPVLFQAGRFHLFEGYDPEVVVAPIRMAYRLGVKTVVLTNAAGSLKRELKPGSIMLIDDHINLQGKNPLRGGLREGEERFPDMSAPYDKALQALADASAREQGIPLHAGVYVAVLGPSYETPAEVGFLRGIGGDAVGMSTVPEAITARALGLKVLAFSLITNLSSGLGAETLDHQEVLEIGQSAGVRLERLIRAILPSL